MANAGSVYLYLGSAAKEATSGLVHFPFICFVTIMDEKLKFWVVIQKYISFPSGDIATSLFIKPSEIISGAKSSGTIPGNF